MARKSRPAVVGIPASVRRVNGNEFHAVATRYIEAVARTTGAEPVLVPAIGDRLDFTDLTRRVDGLLFTGCPSNVEPRHYDEPVNLTPDKRDPDRDATTLPLIRAALADAVPLFAICRGFQELNVALGGSLHQLLHEVPGKWDHRGGGDKPLAERFAPRHHVSLTPGGRLADLAGSSRIVVNSLHGQGVDRLGCGLRVEAIADDGTVEGFRVDGAEAFALGVQWHPEWRTEETSHYGALFGAFGAAVRERALARR